MTNQPTGSKNDASDQAPNDTPRWVKVFAIIAMFLVVLVIVVLLSTSGHGPGRHMGDSLIKQPARVSAVGPGVGAGA